MMENTTEKGLILVNKNSIIYKVQHFMHKILNLKNSRNVTLLSNKKSTIIIPKEIYIKPSIVKESGTDYFKKCTTHLEALNEINKDLTADQIDTLCDLYNKQITALQELK